MYQEAPHVATVATILNVLGEQPESNAQLMKYPGRLPGHLTTGPDASRVAFYCSPCSALDTFKKIETPEWDESAGQGPRRA